MTAPPSANNARRNIRSAPPWFQPRARARLITPMAAIWRRKMEGGAPATPIARAHPSLRKLLHHESRARGSSPFHRQIRGKFSRQDSTQVRGERRDERKVLRQICDRDRNPEPRNGGTFFARPQTFD